MLNKLILENISKGRKTKPLTNAILKRHPITFFIVIVILIKIPLIELTPEREFDLRLLRWVYLKKETLSLEVM